MRPFSRFSALQLYVFFIGCVIVSRLFEENDLPILQYFFVIVGFCFFILALLTYFRK